MNKLSKRISSYDSLYRVRIKEFNYEMSGITELNFEIECHVIEYLHIYI